MDRSDESSVVPLLWAGMITDTRGLYSVDSCMMEAFNSIYMFQERGGCANVRVSAFIHEIMFEAFLPVRHMVDLQRLESRIFENRV
jgi:hypothetical protein